MRTLSSSMLLVAVLGFSVQSCDKARSPTEADQGAVSLAKAANGTIKFSDSFPFSFFNECTGEIVSGVVDVRTTIHTSSDASGGFHAHFHDVFNGRAVGETSGIQYVGPQTDHDSFNASSGGAVEETFTLNFRFNSRGGTDNILSHFLFHVTVTPNGDVTSEVLNMTLDCKG